MNRIEESKIVTTSIIGIDSNKTICQIQRLMDMIYGGETFGEIDIDFFDINGSVLLYGIPGVGKTTIANTMDQCTHEVRAEYWKKIIQACGQRPAGQSAKSWMDENGICEQSYYHWQRRFRKQAYEEMKGNSSVPAVTEKTELSFVEIPCHTSAETNTYMVSDKPVATIRTATLQIDISNEISDALLTRIIQEVSHA